MNTSFRRWFAFIAFLFITSIASGQPFDDTTPKTAKPYRILTSGRQVTVKSNRAIKHIMVWTASGHRIVEQRDINLTNYTFNLSGARERYFFVMLQYEDGKPYTEKIGLY